MLNGSFRSYCYKSGSLYYNHTQELFINSTWIVTPKLFIARCLSFILFPDRSLKVPQSGKYLQLLHVCDGLGSFRCRSLLECFCFYPRRSKLDLYFTAPFTWSRYEPWPNGSGFPINCQTSHSSSDSIRLPGGRPFYPAGEMAIVNWNTGDFFLGTLLLLLILFSFLWIFYYSNAGNWKIKFFFFSFSVRHSAPQNRFQKKVEFFV